MGWISPPSRVTGDLVSASIWNQDVVANTLALKNPAQQWQDVNNSSDYTTTSASFTTIDTTYLELSIVTDGSDLEFFFQGVVNSNTAGTGRTINFDILQVSGSRLAGDDGIISIRTTHSTSDFPVTFCYRKGFPAGVYSFRLQWKVSGDTATLYAGAGTGSGRDIHPQFRVQLVA